MKAILMVLAMIAAGECLPLSPIEAIGAAMRDEETTMKAVAAPERTIFIVNGHPTDIMASTSLSVDEDLYHVYDNEDHSNSVCPESHETGNMHFTDGIHLHHNKHSDEDHPSESIHRQRRFLDPKFSPELSVKYKIWQILLAKLKLIKWKLKLLKRIFSDFPSGWAL